MGKQTKRERKFKATGGVKGRLDKGTITSKGRLKRRNKPSSNSNNSSKNNSNQEEERGGKKRRTQQQRQLGDGADGATTKKKKKMKDHHNDEQPHLLGEANLGDLDIDSFFSKAAATNEDSGDDSSDEDEEEEEPSSSQRSSAWGKKGSPQQQQQRKEKDGSSSGSSDDDASSSSSDDDDDDDGSESRDLDRAETQMKDEMKKMAAKDPEFHQFLQENEESLLEFGGQEDEAEDEDGDDDTSDDDDDDSDEDDDDHQQQPQQPKGKKGKVDNTAADTHRLTLKMLDEWERGAFQQDAPSSEQHAASSIKSLKKLITAYKSACHLADDDDVATMKAKGGGGGKKSKGNKKTTDFVPGESGAQYSIESSKVFDRLMILCLGRCHEAFRYHLLGVEDDDEEDTRGKAKKEAKAKNDDDDEESSDEKVVTEGDDNKPLSPKILERADRWNEIQPILLSFLRSTLHLMSEAKDPELLAYILKALSKYLRFMTPFPRIADAMLKCLTKLWSAPLDSVEDYQVVRLNAFFRIRQLALTQPFPFIEDVLKKTYLAYAKRAKFATGAAAVTSGFPTLVFMGNCLVELYSLDYHSSYQHAFVYIRQLALLLRAAMQKKTKEAMQQVYCWQYMHCLKLWVAVLASASAASGAGQDASSQLMLSLIYPTTEIVLGMARLVPSPARHLPLRFHTIRLLQQLAASSEKFIPTASMLLDCLDWKEWYARPLKANKTSGGSTALSRGLPVQFILKLPKDDTLRTHEQLETMMMEWMLLMQREVELYRYVAAFPEFAVRIVQRLRVFSKECGSRHPRWRSFARGLIEQCERYSADAIQARAQLKQAPKDIQVLECLRPPSVPIMRERLQAAVEKEQKSLNWANDGDSKAESTKDVESNQSKKKSQKKKKIQSNTGVVRGERTSKTGPSISRTEMFDHQDDVQEGIDWSDSD